MITTLSHARHRYPQTGLGMTQTVLLANLGSGGTPPPPKTTTKDTHDGKKYYEDIYEESVEEKYRKFKEARQRLRGQIEEQFFESYDKAEGREVVARIEREIPKLDWEKIELKLFDFALQDKKRKILEEEFIIMELLH